jgi:hypothetical protein
MAFGLIIQRRFHVPLGWPECSGMDGRNGSESVAGIRRNTRPNELEQKDGGNDTSVFYPIPS